MQERHRRTYPADPRGLCQRGRISPLEGLVRRRLLRHRKRRARLLRQQPPLDPRVDKLGAVPSVEADILTMLDAAEASVEQTRRTAALIEQIKSCLTGTQYRRLWMLYARKMNVTAIARAEGISKASASRSISAALKNISAFFWKGAKIGNKHPSFL